MRRVGHARPAGTTWRMRLHDWGDPARPPSLGDLVFEDPEELHRGFKVVGVEETRRSDAFGIVFERMTWEDFIDGVCRGLPVWSFRRDR